jgi:hypothetical protein
LSCAPLCSTFSTGAFRVPDDLDPALANICGALMEDRLADG